MDVLLVFDVLVTLVRNVPVKLGGLLLLPPMSFTDIVETQPLYLALRVCRALRSLAMVPIFVLLKVRLIDAMLYACCVFKVSMSVHLPWRVVIEFKFVLILFP